MKKWIFSLGVSFILIGLSVGVMQGNEHLLNYLLFISIVFLPLSCLVSAGAFYVALKAEEGDRKSIEIGKKYFDDHNNYRAQLSLVALLTAIGTALYFGWIMTAVMFATAVIIVLPAKGLLKKAASFEPSFGDETIEALRQDIEESTPALIIAGVALIPNGEDA